MRLTRNLHIVTLLSTLLLAAACDISDNGQEEEHFDKKGAGVLILCEGNFNAGNASLSYYDPETKSVENGVFARANDRKLGDTGQSILTQGNTAYIAVENSGIVWSIDTETFRVKGQLTTSQTQHMTNPRYVHLVNEHKAYVTDLYAPYITIFNPQTMSYLGSIATGQPTSNNYASTEEMVQFDKYVFTNCWCYSRNILVIDSEQDLVVDSIVLSSWQPKSMKLDAHGKLWVITDGGYSTPSEEFSDNVPHLYRIDAATRKIELDLAMQSDESMVQIAMNPARTLLYVLDNDIYRMGISDNQLPTQAPFITAPVDKDGTRHKLYGIDVNPANGEIYVADAVDYRQSGMVYRYSDSGSLIDQFRVGVTPNHFAFLSTKANPNLDPDTPEEEKEDHSLVNRIFEYMPAPGHQVNGYTVVGDFIHDGATMQEACDSVLSHFRHMHMVSLGGQGGYLVAGFDHNVTNSQGGYDIAIKGNPYSYQSEPGIIWVSQDVNGDGEPNDPWYELAGSEYNTENETLGYAITYYKPTAPNQDIRWTDNQGGEGVVPYMEAWNKHPYYWQDWIPTEQGPEGEYHTYYGSRLKDRSTYENSFSTIPPYDWGYADNQGSDYFRNADFNANIALGYYKISNAVREDGTPANLEYINFVKVQTAQTGCTPNLGEISTEVYGIWDVHYEK